MNNLLERLHASLFFYIMKGPNYFLKIGQYLPSAVLVSVAIMFGGLRLWVDAGWFQSAPRSTFTEKSKSQTPSETPSPAPPKWQTRRRNVLPPLAVMVGTHVVGWIAFLIATNKWYISSPSVGSSNCQIFFLLVFNTPCWHRHQRRICRSYHSVSSLSHACQRC
ncbi:MAG TPA: hypothetical protein VGO47_15050 [Chlamydiales bacterium]|nr:hypothetical protein [Chlamydiales bacterium]